MNCEIDDFFCQPIAYLECSVDNSDPGFCAQSPMKGLKKSNKLDLNVLLDRRNAVLTTTRFSSFKSKKMLKN